MSPIPAPRSHVLVVDDDPILRAELQVGLERAGYACTAASDVHHAMQLLRSECPDVVVTDLMMPGLDGLHLLDLIRQLDQGVPVLVLTGHPSIETAIAALRHGRAFDYLEKPLNDLAPLIDSIERAIKRQPKQLPSPGEGPAVPGLDQLTPREKELLVLLAKGQEVRAISAQVHLSERTVRNYLSAIYGKLGIRNRAQAVILAHRLQQGE